MKKLEVSILACLLVIVTSLGVFSITGAPVLVFSSNGAFVPKTTLAAAVASADTTNKTVYVVGYTPLSADLTIPTTIGIKFVFGGYVATNGYNCTISGPIGSDLHKIFVGSGVKIANGSPVYPQWWGAKADFTSDDGMAINYAIDSLQPGGGTVSFPRGGYATYSSSRVTMKPFTTLQGMDRVTAPTATRMGAIIIGSHHSDVIGQDVAGKAVTEDLSMGVFDLFLDGLGTAKTGLNWSQVHGGKIARVNVIRTTQYGIKINNPDSSHFSDSVNLEDCYVNMSNSSYFASPTTYPIYSAYYFEGFFHKLVRAISDGGVSSITLAGGALGGSNVIENSHSEGFTKQGINVTDSNGSNRIINNIIVSIYNSGNLYSVDTQVGIYMNGGSGNGLNVVSDNTLENINHTTPVINSFGILATTTSVASIYTSNVITGFNYGVNVSSPLNNFTNNSVDAYISSYVLNSAYNTISGGYAACNVSTGYLVLVNSGVGNRVTNLLSPSDSYSTRYSGIVPFMSGSAAASSRFDISSDGKAINFQGIVIQVGTGSPESLVSAGVGSLYLDMGFTASHALWVKQTGSGTTGWVGK